jgi:hypothetical protein
MKVNMNINTAGVNVPPAINHPAKPAKVAGDGVSFEGSAALDEAVKGLPDSRPEAVDRARELINNPNYPSQETVGRLSQFLATKLTSGGE